MEKCLGRRQEHVERCIKSCKEALELAMSEVITLKKRNGKANKNERNKLKQTIASNLRRLRRQVTVITNQNLSITTESLEDEIAEYEKFFAENFPNKAQMPKPGYSQQHSNFRHMHRPNLTPTFYMGRGK